MTFVAPKCPRCKADMQLDRQYVEKLRGILWGRYDYNISCSKNCGIMFTSHESIPEPHGKVLGDPNNAVLCPVIEQQIFEKICAEFNNG